MRNLFLSATLLTGLAAQNGPLLILEKGASALGFYAPDGQLMTAVPVGAHPHEIVFSADHRFAYTTDNGTFRIEEPGTGGNTVSIVNLHARKKVGEIDLGRFRRPHGIDLDRSTGHLAVSCELPDQLLIVDPVSRKVVRTYETKGKTAHMVKFGPGAKWAYVSHSNSSNVAAIELSTGNVKLIATRERPEGSVLSHDGKFLYVVNREGRQISIIDTAKNEAVGAIQTGNGPVRIDITPDDGLLVYALMHDRAIEFADPRTRKVLGRVPVDGDPVSLNLSPDGKLAFAAAEEIDTVYVVSAPDRKMVRQFKVAAGTHPDPVMPMPK